MCIDKTRNALIIYHIVLAVLCSSLSACIPLSLHQGDHPFKDSLTLIEPRKTEQREVHQILGSPLISSEEWNVDVYRVVRQTKEIMIPLPLPPVPSSALYHAIFVYDEDGRVKAFDSGMGLLVADGYRFYGTLGTPITQESDILVAPKMPGEFNLSDKGTSTECTLILIGDNYQRIYVNSKYISHGNSETYLRLMILPGTHIISFTSEYPDLNGKTSISCEPGNIIYVQILRRDPDMKTTNIAPEELYERHLVIHPFMPEQPIPSPYIDDPIAAWKLYMALGGKPKDIYLLCEAADGGVAKAQSHLGWLYTIGLGIPQDITRAYMWYKLAGTQEQDALKSSMTSREISEAKQLFSKWQPGQCERDLINVNSGN